MYASWLTLAIGKRTNMLAFSHRRKPMSEAQDHWATLAKRHIKAELKRAGVGYAELARRLTEMGLQETEGSVTVKINRGAFPAWFLFAAMHALGVPTVRLREAD
jgi:hypothetical protein